ncbi:MAG: STAS domain-containing protein [Eubacterium sp.]|nr:STAS domain-containing protein [Eubacterium sp.]
MEITKTKDAGKSTIALSGRLDTTTAPQFEAAVNDVLPGTEELVFDLKDMSYTSSAGLRVFLKAQKAMSAQGEMKLINVQPDVLEIFEITGFVDILNIE